MASVPHFSNFLHPTHSLLRISTNNEEMGGISEKLKWILSVLRSLGNSKRNPANQMKRSVRRQRDASKLVRFPVALAQVCLAVPVERQFEG